MKQPSRKFAILMLAIIFSVATSFVFSGTTILDLQASAKPLAVFSHAMRNAIPTISPNPVAAATLPDAPQNLATQAGNGQNFLGWNAPSSNGGATITSYRVFRGTNSANPQLVTSGGCANLGAVFACTDTGLTNGQSYDYVVSTVNSVGQGAPSNSATATASTAAQFSQQGPKLVGTGAVGNAQQGYSVSLSADGNTAIVGGPTDNSNAGAAWVFTASANPDCSPVVITTPPQNQAVPSGQTATLNVTASGTAPLSYQWYEGAKGDTSKPVGTNASSFMTPALTANKSYWVRVSNSCGTVDSETAVIQIGQPKVDLSVKVSTDITSINLGGSAKFKVVVKNNGNTTAKGSILKTNFVQVRLDDIAAGKEVAPEIPAITPVKPGAFKFTAQAVPQEGDANPADNEASITINVAVSPPDSMPDGFLYFSGQFSPEKPTIVFTHGLSAWSDVAGLPNSLWTGDKFKKARNVLNSYFLDKKEKIGAYNVIQYVWYGAFQVGLPPPIRSEYVNANNNVPFAGKFLAKRLLDVLTPEYSNNILFVGHSLGTAVNTYAAADFLAKATKVSSAQLTYLDRPHHVNKIPESGKDVLVCKLGPSENDTFEDSNGYDSFRYIALLRNVGISTSHRLRLDNYYTKSGCAGVGDYLFSDKDFIATKKYIITNYELNYPSQVGDSYFKEEDIIANDHSGVQQWFRLTISPNYFDQKLCDGGFHPPPPSPSNWNSSLNPCGPYGWLSTNIANSKQSTSVPDKKG